MLNVASDLKELGYNQELLGLDDVTIGLDGKTVLDRFLETCLQDAGFIIENIISVATYELSHTDLLIQPRIKRAELILGQKHCLEYVYAKGLEITDKLKIEGIEVESVLDKDSFTNFLSMLSEKAKQLLSMSNQGVNNYIPSIVTIKV